MPDIGLSGTPAAVTAALTARGFQVNADGSISQIDPTLNTDGLFAAGYRVLDGVAYILVRTPGSIPLPAGLTVLSAQVTSALVGVILADTLPSPPSVISINAFFARLTAAEKAAIIAGMASRPAIAQAIVRAALSDGVDLLAANTKAFMDTMVTAGFITAARETVILTP